MEGRQMPRRIITPLEQKVNTHLGRRLHTLRRERNLTQMKIGDIMGVTFQQVQKYERGLNTMNAIRIYQIAIGLNISPLYFFEGLPGLDISGRTTCFAGEKKKTMV